ncbi:hypothetical protein [Nostoc sp. ChiVER01]|uniref:hypothetical protein n=1 Tax=Nostoc sp. ChiVER01 TaxID=3075382 RepID=UPI002AD3C2E5|nr:hypothetical protein [Nostoc sp. ChiVER01]MDZ8227541.1 hypothetical protein [Nostoc sp. ChiVER01]
MTMSEDLLIDLCEPYLLDLIGLLAESIRRLEDNVYEIAKDSGYDIPDTVLSRISSLDYLQKAQVLAIAANHVKAIAEREGEL